MAEGGSPLTQGSASWAYCSVSFSCMRLRGGLRSVCSRCAATADRLSRSSHKDSYRVNADLNRHLVLPFPTRSPLRFIGTSSTVFDAHWIYVGNLKSDPFASPALQSCSSTSLGRPQASWLPLSCLPITYVPLLARASVCRTVRTHIAPCGLCLSCLHFGTRHSPRLTHYRAMD